MLETTARHDFEAPFVSCKGCAREYAQKESGAALIEQIGAYLVACTNCDKPEPTPRIFAIPNKVIGRDVACRYIVRYDGRTFWHQTDVDDAEVYLQDRKGNVIARVSPFDRFPKPLDATEFDDIPF